MDVHFPVRNRIGSGERGVATFVSFETPPIHQASALSGTLTVMGKQSGKYLQIAQFRTQAELRPPVVGVCLSL